MSFDRLRCNQRDFGHLEPRLYDDRLITVLKLINEVRYSKNLFVEILIDRKLIDFSRTISDLKYLFYVIANLLRIYTTKQVNVAKFFIFVTILVDVIVIGISIPVVLDLIVSLGDW